jgi:hypothetical protein
VLSQHQTNLADLRTDYETLVKLSAKSAALEDDRHNAQHFLEVIADRLLEGESDPELAVELAGWDRKLVSFKAQEELNNRLSRTAETELQKRLGADIAACERLYSYWISHVEDRESAVLLETVEPSRKNSAEVAQAARTLAIAGKAYGRMVAELGEAAPVSYAWSRPLDPLPSEKSVAIQTLLAHDPLFGPPKRSDTVAALLSAAERQVSRWTALLAAVAPAVAAGEFAMPSYVEPEPDYRPMVQPEWNEDLDRRSWKQRYLDSIGKTWDELTPEQKQILIDSEAQNESFKTEPVKVVAEIVAEN